MSPSPADAGTSIPDRDGALEAALTEFNEDLIALRAAAGAPSYQQLARRIGQPRSTVYDAFRRASLPSLELLIALVTALGGDVAAWRERWAELRTRLDAPADVTVDRADAAKRPDSDPRTSSDGTERPWWRRGLPVAGVAVLAAGVSCAATLAATGSDTSDGCTSYRVYRMTEAGPLLTANSVTVGDARIDDVILVRADSTRDHTFHARYPAVDANTGDHGYVDESKLDPLRDNDCF